MRLSTVLLYVKDLAGMTAFYGETLGLPMIAETRTETWVEFDMGGARLGLHQIPAHIAVDTTAPREETPYKLCCEVDDVAALGIPFIQRPWGGVDGVDPEGNIIGLVETNRVDGGERVEMGE